VEEYRFYGRDPETGEPHLKAYWKNGNWGGKKKELIMSLLEEMSPSILEGKKFNIDSKKHRKMLPKILHGSYLWAVDVEEFRTKNKKEQ